MSRDDILILISLYLTAIRLLPSMNRVIGAYSDELFQMS